MSSPAGSIARLDPRVWKAEIQAYILAKATKKEADAASRAADSTIKAFVARALDAMKGAPAATCGSAVLTRKETSAANASITLRDGSKIAWSDVTSVLVGNHTIAAADVATIYGGRSGSTALEVAGTP